MRSLLAPAAVFLGLATLGGCGLQIAEPWGAANAAVGSLDESFDAGWGSGFTGSVDAIAMLSDGGILAAGRFTAFDARARGGLVKFSADGVPDPGFGPFAISPANASVHAVAVQSDGRVLVGGDFSGFAGGSTAKIARLLPNGQLDTSFAVGSTGFDGVVSSIALDSQGRVYVGGTFSTYGGSAAPRLVRLAANGVRDTGFAVGSGFSLDVNEVVVESDDRVLAGGSFTAYQGISRSRFVRLLSDGSVDASFATAIGTAANGSVNALLSTSTGILVGGNFSFFGGLETGTSLWLDAFGARRASFLSAGDTSAFARQADGAILVGGDFNRVLDRVATLRLARISSDGTALDEAFLAANGTGFDGVVRALAIQADGKILVGGEFRTFNGVAAAGLLRLK